LVDHIGEARVLNIPSESQFLYNLAPSWTIDFADFEVSKLMEEIGVKKTCYNLSTFEDNSFDAIIGIAPLHHLNDNEQIEFITAVKQKLISGGRFVIAEPLRESNVALFLDTFIDRYSSTCHIGNYPSAELLKLLTKIGFVQVKMITIDCGLVFLSEYQMIEWLKKALGIQFSNKQRLISELEQALGITKTKDCLQLNWELTFFIAEA